MIKYYKLEPSKIYQNIIQSTQEKKVLIKDTHYFVHPCVYPSDQFRTTNFLLDSIKHLVCNKTICDMGCGIGIVGFFSLQHGAKYIIQADINPFALANTKANKASLSYSDTQVKIMQSDCFDNIPRQLFDIIIFNIPFHSQQHAITHPLEYAFYDPNFESTKKFIQQSINYSHSTTNIFIAFSNKGNVLELENIFNDSCYNWELWKQTNTNQKFDNRIYKLTKGNLK